VLVTNCLQTANPTYCSQIVRTSTDFSLQGRDRAGGGYIVQDQPEHRRVLQRY